MKKKGDNLQRIVSLVFILTTLALIALSFYHELAAFLAGS